MMNRPPHTLTGAAQKRDCCALACDYRPEAVAVYLAVVLDMERHGEDASEVAACKPINRNGSGGTAGEGNTRILDVTSAVAALRSEGRAVTPVSVAERLCPWSL